MPSQQEADVSVQPRVHKCFDVPMSKIAFAIHSQYACLENRSVILSAAASP